MLSEIVAQKARARQKERLPNRYFRDVATILGRDVTLEEDASHATDYKPKPIRLKCRVLTSSSGAEVEEGEQIVSIMGFQVRFAVDADIKSTDRLQIKGQEFSIVAISPERTDPLYLIVECVRS